MHSFLGRKRKNWSVLIRVYVIFLYFVPQALKVVFIGGVRGIKGNDGYYGMEIRVDTQYCYACDDELKHPEDGTLYEAGHQVDGFYDYC
jgi:hypothetical protein